MHPAGMPLKVFTERHNVLTISVLQACCSMTTEHGIPGDFVRISTASLQIKITTAQVNF